jgi:hypothetical protein
LKKIFIIFFLILIGNPILIAQTEKNIDHQSLLWTRYCTQLTLNKKWAIHSELDNRLFLKPVAENLFVIRVQARNKIAEQVELGAGFAYFSVATQEPEIKAEFSIPEYRGQQDITLKHSLGKIGFSHRYQLEERFIHKADQLGLLDGSAFYLRFRYRIQVDCNLWKSKKQYLKAIVSDEIMINGRNKIIKNTFDQNRIYAALQFGISSSLAAEVGYLNSFQQRSNGVDYFNRDIIRISIYHRLKI